MSDPAERRHDGHVSPMAVNGNARTPPSSPDVKPVTFVGVLEEEARAAVRELAFAVRTVSISELLPRTNDLLFLNLTTLEAQSYCIELTIKGWRVASNRHDCMNGDFRDLALHTRYFDTVYQLLDVISPRYRQEFSAALATKLIALQENQDGKN